MTNAERAGLIVDEGMFRGERETFVTRVSTVLDEAEARGYERATNELAAKESEISRAAYNRAIEDAAKACDDGRLDDLPAMMRDAFIACGKAIRALKSPPEKGQP